MGFLVKGIYKGKKKAFLIKGIYKGKKKAFFGFLIKGIYEGSRNVVGLGVWGPLGRSGDVVSKVISTLIGVMISYSVVT